MLVLNTFTILIQVAFIVFMTLISMNILRYLSGGVRNMVAIAPALFVNHGGGPMPLLGDKESIGLTKFLRDEVKKYVNLRELKAIILVTAHWEESKVTISSSDHHDLYFDYYGFPPETYKYRYDAPGDPELAKRIHTALTKAGIDSKLDPTRGWDHGVFVPMMLINPDADVPIIQISVLGNQNAEEHYKLGQALYQFRKEGVAIIGSGMSYHNMREFRFNRYAGKVCGVRNMVAIAPALFVNHGGGPMPLLGDKESIGLTKFLRDEVKKYVNLKELKAIILVTAHWEESKVTISSSDHHDLYFDYYGFPPETYKYRYDAPGDPELAKRIHTALTKASIDSKLDPTRGWDHGVFVPMMLINPDADVPIIQISVLGNQNAEEHYKLGQALYQFRKEGVAIIGSGMSYHNMREFRYNRYAGKVVNEEFDVFLNQACTSTNEKRKEQLIVWEKQPGANDAHPPRAAEHLMPLIVVAGAGGEGSGQRVFNWDLAGSFRLSGFIWKNE